jgi:hypothetical protein
MDCVDSFLPFKTLSIVKEHDIYEIHYCGFVINATFDPFKVISSSGEFDETIFVHKDDDYSLRTYTFGNGIMLIVRRIDLCAPSDDVMVKIVCYDDVIHVKIDGSGDLKHIDEEFDAEVTYKYRFSKTKSARTRKPAGSG